MGYLILVRHGKSDLKPDDKFVGWMDVPLSKKELKKLLIVQLNLKISKLILLLPQTLFEHRKLFLHIIRAEEFRNLYP